MSLIVSDVVVSLNGRDSGNTFFVVGVDGDYALIADGRVRRLERPKRKKQKHLKFVRHGEGRVADKLRSGEHVSNGDIRRALQSAINAPEVEGGMHSG